MHTCTDMCMQYLDLSFLNIKYTTFKLPTHSFTILKNYIY